LEERVEGKKRMADVEMNSAAILDQAVADIRCGCTVHCLYFTDLVSGRDLLLTVCPVPPGLTGEEAVAQLMRSMERIVWVQEAEGDPS
jgi:hypothetical protein